MAPDRSFHLFLSSTAGVRSAPLPHFQRCFEQAGMAHTTLVSPSFLTAPPATGSGARAVHLAFDPPEKSRLLKGATNILVFAWAFSTMRTDAMLTSSHPFESQARMLDLVDAIWTPSRHSAKAIAALTRRPVRVIPVPVPASRAAAQARTGNRTARQRAGAERLSRPAVGLSIFPRFQGAASAMAIESVAGLGAKVEAVLAACGRATIFLTEADPREGRAGLGPAIDAFCRLAQRCDHAIWIIHAVSPEAGPSTVNALLLAHQLSEETTVAGQYFSDRVLLCTGLDDEERASLHALCDFYLCTAQTEGQTIPLHEAMAEGLVPVSVRHTAMADVIDEDGAVVIASSPVDLPPAAARTYGLTGAQWHVAAASEIHDALLCCLRMNREAYHRLSCNAVLRMERACSHQAVAALVTDALA